MTSNIFFDYAPKYWDAGIPVMPLKIRSKAPLLNEWTAYGRVAPTTSIKGLWLESYPHSNIGLPFGPASGLCAIDIDTVDPDLVEVIMDCLPPSPWTRIGKKGCALIYRWSGQKNFKIRSQSDGMILEMLGQGNQLVLPPSLHPDTGEAYTSNVDLWDVVSKIQPLPTNIEETLRNALGVHGGVSLTHEGRSSPLRVVPQGERDIEMVRRAGYYARVVLGIDKTDKFSLADALKHMHAWVCDFTAGVAGDDMDPDKGVSKLLEFLIKDVESGKSLPDGWDAGLTAEQLDHPSIKALYAGNEVARWTFSKARAWFEDQLALKPKDDDWALQVSQEIIEKVAADDNFTEMHFDALIKVLQKGQGDLKLSTVQLRKAFKEARQGVKDTAADHEEIARQVLREFERVGEVRYAQGTFWQWNGSCFKSLDREDVYKFIAETVKGNVLARRHNDYESITKTISVLARRELVESLESGVNFANGFLDTEGVLHEHSPKFGRTFTMPFNYVPERAAEAHKWFEYLERAWGDEPDYDQRVMALQEAFAATMFGLGPQYQRAVLLHGKAGSGKSVALEVLKAMMPPEAVCSLPPTLWGEKYVLAEMVGKTLNVCGELSESGAISGDIFKEVIVGATTRTERKNQPGFDFQPIATHWFASNHLPRSRDTSMGFVRRWLLLSFTRVVPADEVITDFHEVLVAEEREAIAAWAVQGLKRLIDQRGYTLPESHVRQLNIVRRANNSVAAFLETTSKVQVTGNEDDKADMSAVFDQYIWYCREVARCMTVGFERFYQMVDELGYTVSEYEDELLGHKKHQVSGMKLADIPLDQKWRKGP